MLIIWLKVREFLELEKFGEAANPCVTERVKNEKKISSVSDMHLLRQLPCSHLFLTHELLLVTSASELLEDFEKMFPQYYMHSSSQQLFNYTNDSEFLDNLGELFYEEWPVTNVQMTL